MVSFASTPIYFAGLAPSSLAANLALQCIGQNISSEHQGRWFDSIFYGEVVLAGRTMCVKNHTASPVGKKPQGDFP